MPKVMKTCRVCGRSYEACRTTNSALGVFRWQEVACSPECGATYLQKLNESRSIHAEKLEERPIEQPVNESVVEQEAESIKRPARKRKTKDIGVVPLRLEADGEGADIDTDHK